MSTPPNGPPLVRLSGRRRPESPQATFGFVDGDDDPSIPPLDDEGNVVRALCPVERPCPRFRCKHHMDADDERAGRPYDGKHPPSQVRRRQEEQLGAEIRPSCVLDMITDENGNPASEGVELGTKQIAESMGVSQRRIEQLLGRGRDKMLVVGGLIDVVEDHAERNLYPRGARVTMHWGVEMVGDMPSDASPSPAPLDVMRLGVSRQRCEANQVYVTIKVDLAQFDRPAEYGNRAGVTVRKRETR